MGSRSRAISISASRAQAIWLGSAENKASRPRSCAGVSGEDILRVRHESLPRLCVTQKIDSRLMQLIGRVHLHRSAAFDEPSGKNAKIFHVRTEDDWLARENHFGRVLSAVGKKTFTDEHHGGDGVPVSQLTRGVEQQAIKVVVDRV